ncbi:TPA: helix-turn-helix domain-containing protein, partial [Enterobacter ludwigii]
AVFGCDKLLPLASTLNCDPLWLLGANTDQVATNEAPLAPVKVMQGVDMSTIGKRINARRVALRFSPAELEKIANLPEGTVSLWEDGKAFPPSDAINKLAPVLHTNIHWLVTGIEIAKES